jgi:hypothetical protein
MSFVKTFPKKFLQVYLIANQGLLKKLPTVFGKVFSDFLSSLGASKSQGTVKNFDIFGNISLNPPLTDSLFPLTFPPTSPTKA